MDVEKMKSKRDVEGLIKALKSKNLNVREKAAEALGMIKDARAVIPLIDALNDESVRGSAAYALGKIGDSRAVAPLIQALKEEDFYKESHGIPIGVRGSVVDALTSIGETAIEPLISVIEEKPGDIQEKGIITLHNILEVLYRRDDIHDDREEIQRVQQFKLDRVVEPLIATLRRQDIQHDADIPSGMHLMGLPNCIVSLLGMIRDERAVEPLTDILERGKAEGLIFTSAWALAKIGSKKAVDPIRKAITDCNGILGQIGLITGDVELLIAGLEEMSKYPAAMDELEIGKYVRAFERTGDKRAVKPLIVAAIKYLELGSDAYQNSTKVRSEEVEEMIFRGGTTLARIGAELVNTATRIDSEKAHSEALKCDNAYILKLVNEAVERVRRNKES